MKYTYESRPLTFHEGIANMALIQSRLDEEVGSGFEVGTCACPGGCGVTISLRADLGTPAGSDPESTCCLTSMDQLSNFLIYLDLEARRKEM